MRAWYFGVWRRAAFVAGFVGQAELLRAQAASVDSAAHTAPELRITAAGATPVLGRLVRATRDSLVVRVSDVPYSLSRKDISRLELRASREGLAEQSERNVLGVVKAGLITTGVLATLGSIPCLNEADRNSDMFPCYTLGLVALGLGIPSTIVVAVVVGAASMVPEQPWLPVDAATWRVSLDTRTLNQSPFARPLLSFRIAF
jgi:hypothetical protein